MRIFIFSLFFLLIILTVFLGYSEHQNDGKYKYRVEYGHGKYGWSDYTNNIQHNSDNSITYTNENGCEVTRYGTYSITKIKEKCN